MAQQPHDHFDRYFAEKVWALIPEHYREQDGLEDVPGVLRGFVEVLAQQAATLRRSSDALWDDAFIDLCAEWAVPYIGQLVATRMISALNPSGRRIDVAKTIYYRRRAGTPRILEELIADIARWEGKVVEEFRRLARMRHGLDPKPQAYAGVLTGTMPGGTADLRSAHGAELADSPFDEFHHTPDVRRPRGRDGRYGIAKLGFHLYRLLSTRLADIPPLGGPLPGTFTFDPSGRDVPLFARRHRIADRERFDWEAWESAREWQVPSPIRCRLLNRSAFVITEQVLATLEPVLTAPPVSLSAADADLVLAFLRRFREQRIPSESRLFQISEALAPAALHNGLQNPAAWNALLVAALVPECGKRALLPQGVYATNAAPTPAEESTSTASVVVKTFRNDLGRFVPVPRELIVSGDLSNWTAAPGGVAKQWVVDPKRGRLLWIGGGAAPADVRVTYHNGFSGPVGAGGYDRAAELTAASTGSINGGGSITTADLPAAGVIDILDSMTYSPVANRNNITALELRAANEQRPLLLLTSNWRLGAANDAELTLNGLWIAGGSNLTRALRLRGDYATVTLRHVTLDPGGVTAAGNVIRPVPLEIRGNVKKLVIESSIVGTIRVVAPGELTELEIRDSIVDGLGAAVPVVSVPAGRVTMRRVTVFGDVEVEWLDASEALITGIADVTNTQRGCFRFSAVLDRRGASVSRVPHAFESHRLPDFAGVFTSRTFGAPGYAQLAESAPESLLRGAENRSEIGAFSALVNPIKADGLRAKVEEFAPFGLLPLYIAET